MPDEVANAKHVTGDLKQGTMANMTDESRPLACMKPTATLRARGLPEDRPL